jgi:uncharacterized membrane protein
LPLGAQTTHPIFASVYMWVNGADLQPNRAVGAALASGTTAGSTRGGITIDGAGNIRFANTYGQMYGAAGIVETGRLNDIVDRWLRLEVLYNPAGLGDNISFKLSGLGTSAGASSVTGSRAITSGTVNHFIFYSDWTSASANSNAVVFWDDLHVEAVPEPGTLIALGLGAAAMVARRRRRVS